jgi:hypothetical protein
MRNKYIQFDDSLFQQKVRLLAKKFNLDEKEFVKDQGGLFMRDLARYIPPYKSFPGRGTTLGNKKDQMAGKLAIEYDLKKLFFIPDARVFKWAQRMFPMGEIYKGRKVIGAGVINSISEMRRFHNANRKPSNGRARSLKGFQQMWVDENMFDTYKFMVQRDVGVAKASMAKGMLMLKPKVKGIPAWVRAQMGKATGSARMHQLNKSWTAFFNARAYGLQHLSQGTIKIVQRGRLKAMETRLKKTFREAAKESGWKVK